HARRSPRKGNYAPARGKQDLAIRLQCDRSWGSNRGCGQPANTESIIQLAIGVIAGDDARGSCRFTVLPGKNHLPVRLQRQDAGNRSERAARRAYLCFHKAAAAECSVQAAIHIEARQYEQWGEALFEIGDGRHNLAIALDGQSDDLRSAEVIAGEADAHRPATPESGVERTIRIEAHHGSLRADLSADNDLAVALQGYNGPKDASAVRKYTTYAKCWVQLASLGHRRT